MATEDDSFYTCRRCDDRFASRFGALLCPRCSETVRRAIKNQKAGRGANPKTLVYAKYLPECATSETRKYFEEAEARRATQREREQLEAKRLAMSEKMPERFFGKSWQRLVAEIKGPKFCLGCGAWMKLTDPSDYCPACEERRQRRAKNG